MKFKWITAIAITAMAITSCSEDTEGIGASLTDENDMLEITTGSFTAFTRSIEVDSVFSRNFDCHLGMVKDPETGAYVINEFMAQFNILENMKQPAREDILGMDDGDIAADSCEIWLQIDRTKSYGDSLTPVKINVLEDDKEYKVELAAPGMKKEDFNVNINHEGNLVIKMESKLEKKDEDKKARYLRREFSYSKFEQTLLLPEDVDKDKIAASVADGVLTVDLPKIVKEEVKVARQITVG